MRPAGHAELGTAGLAVSALTLSNVASHRWLPSVAHVPANLALAAGMVCLARGAGHTIDELGLGRGRIAQGLRVGATGSALVGFAYLGLLKTDRANGLLHDQRLTRLNRRDTLRRLLVEIPLGTALAEEVVFRGVLPRLLRFPRQPRWVSPVLASVLFGLWHVLPAYEQADANHVARNGRMAVTVLSTAAAGGILHRLRVRTGHVAAPFALHCAVNILGLLAVREASARR